MHPSRRKFITNIGATLLGGACCGRSYADSAFSRETVHSLLKGSGYRQDTGDGVVLGVIADPHIFLGREATQYWTEKWDDGLIGELNGLCPLMTDIVIAGDLISYRSMTPGLPRYPLHEDLARQEYEMAKRQMSRFDSRFRLWAVPGNHDTDAHETDANLWREMLGVPPYRKAVLGGVPIFFLNSGNGGMLNSGQLAWFRAEAAGVPDEQEVVIVMHHPVFFALREEAAMKRILCEMFGGRRGKVWILSGHGHAFADASYIYDGTTFVQMEVTGANPIMFSDHLSPGYIVVALQDGRVVCRLFRSLKQDGFGIRKAPLRAAVTKVEFQFDGVQMRADAFEEGLYDRMGRVLSFSGVHVGSYFAYLKKIIIQVRPQDYLGRLGEVILAGTIPATVQPTCQISRTGADGSWEPLVFPEKRGSGLFRISIPEAYRTTDSFQLKVDTGLKGNVTGFSLSGWALASDPSSLSTYERWLQKVYGHLRREPATEPMAVVPNTTNANVLHFAFGLPVIANVGGVRVVPGGEIAGMPRYLRMRRSVVDFRFARRRAESLPGVKCVVERTTDLRSWEKIDEAAFVVRGLDSVWEEVSMTRIVVPGRREFLRVAVIEDGQVGTGLGQWRMREVRPLGTATDGNANGVEDLLEYAFDLGGGVAGLRGYDSERTGAWAGIPRHGVRRIMVSVTVFPRMKPSAQPGVEYALEWSPDMAFWSPVPSWQIAERVLRSEGDWDEVEVTILDDRSSNRFYRVAVSLV